MIGASNGDAKSSVGGVVMRAARAVSGTWRWADLRGSIGELGRALAMLLVLRPAADYLPRSVALALADYVAFALAALSSGARSFHREMHATFGGEAAHARWLARETLALPFRDFVMLRRIVAGREDARGWPIEERNLEAVQALRDSGAPFIVAVGHFARRAVWCVHLPRVIPQRPIVVVNPPPPRSFRPQGLRLYLQFGLMLQSLKVIRQGLELYVAGRGTADTLVQWLRTPGNAAVIHADAPWPFRRGSIERPFAAATARSFATGVAKVARLAQCPIVACVTTVSPQGQILFEWTGPIAQGSLDDAASDTRVTSAVLDALEVGIGRHPEQYVLDFGSGRRWNAEAEVWEPAEAKPAPA
jgi:lauroyl/myristoyl acyltransferase